MKIGNSSAQTPGEWTWMGGDSTTAIEAVYGIQGVPSILNHPPSVYEGCEWIDNNGNFWFYGGLHQDSLAQLPTCGDLWKLNPATQEWTWMNGPGIPDQYPVYGTLRVAAASNYPGAKCFGSISMVDHNGIFWMYGGYEFTGSTSYSDLWSYDPSTNLWTWMSGQPLNNYQGAFGIKGVPSILNSPPTKQECNAGWVDSLNNVWIFGGQGPSSGFGNDLWKYDVQTYEWTWMNGDSTSNASGVYGVKGVSDPANTPGGRRVYSRWTDSDNNFWLFGGSGITGAYNDLWRYEVSTNLWTWMNGTSLPFDDGFYDTLCHASALNTPSYRNECRTVWKDSCDNMFLFGGFYRSDLWVYNRFTNEWSTPFQGPGPNMPSYGIKGVSSATNSPGDRGGSSPWLDADQNLWLFGGFPGAGGYKNDLWRYVPDPACKGCIPVMPSANFSSVNTIFCPGTCTDFVNLSSGASSYQWNLPGGNPSVSTNVSPTGICYNTPGSYDVTLIATNANGSDTLTIINYITVFPQPPPQGIMQNGDTLFGISGAPGYQWYYNNNIIIGATDYFYVATASGNYNVVATDDNGCEGEAVLNNVIANTTPLSFGEGSGVRLFPNPVEDKFTIHNAQFTMGTAPKGVLRTFEISIYNVLGEKVMAVCCGQSATSDPSFGGLTVDCRLLPSGMYSIEIISGENIYRTKFLKQ